MTDRSGATGGGSGVPTSVGPDEGDAYWILGTLDTVKIPSELTEGRFAMLESRDRHGDAPPLHVHEDADETYYVSRASTPSSSATSRCARRLGGQSSRLVVSRTRTERSPPRGTCG